MNSNERNSDPRYPYMEPNKNESTRSLGFVKVHIDHSRRAKDEEDGHAHGFDTVVRYDDFVRMLFKKQSEELMAMHIGLGIAGEAGEISDVIKRQYNYQSLNMPDMQSFRQAMVEELGDLRFYIQAAMNHYSINEQEILDHNAKKLGKRYAQLRYSDEAAAVRADKTPGT